MMDSPPRTSDRSPVFTIPSSADFLRVLARALLDGTLPHGNTPAPPLPCWTVLLPTRRSGRALQQAFLAEAGFGATGGAMLLPVIRPIAEGDEAASTILAPPTTDALLAALPAAVDPLERRLILTRMVMAWSESRRANPLHAPIRAQTPSEAAGLAASLARLMDLLETEGVGLERLPQLVPAELAGHWQQTLDFLDILASAWPGYLAATGRISPAARRNAVLLREATRFGQAVAGRPVVIAGVTGSVPATAALMRAVVDRPGNAVVLPGLDLDLDEAAWQAAGADPAHPQFRLHHLLRVLDVARADVRPLTAGAEPERRVLRRRFISEAMRPAETTTAWSTLTQRMPAAEIRAGLAGVVELVAPSSADEAEVIALILKEAAEHTDRSAALVTPDRTLARRVITRLAGWGIAIDDSAGRPFTKTVPGVFLDLITATVASGFAPAPLMALLKHPLTRLGLDVAGVRRSARMLELAAFRRTYLGRGIAGLAAAVAWNGSRGPSSDDAADDLERPHRAVHRMAARDRAAAADLVARLDLALAPLNALAAAPEPLPLATLVAAHRAAAEALAADEAGSAAALWQGEAGEMAADLLGALTNPDQPVLMLRFADYPDLFRSLVAGETVRTRQPVHPRLSIWGPYEARLQQPDIVVLGGLVDGGWPEVAEPDPWLSRTMLTDLGLPSPEARLGDAAHDFVQLLGAAEVYLTRAGKVDGVPRVASRWLLRIAALLKGAGITDCLTPDRPWLDWAAHRRSVVEPVRATRPMPRPPLSARPRALSVSDVARWIRNPYALYAKAVLGLEPLPELGREPEDRLRGMMVHAVLGRFTRRASGTLPPDAKAILTRLIDEVLASYGAHPRVAALWRPRLARFADWFLSTELARREGGTKVLAEISGSMTVRAPAGAFCVRARADRIDLMATGGVVITDYKSGRTPSAKAVEELREPQLPLEAAILQNGGFLGEPPSGTLQLRYIAAGGGIPPGAEALITNDAAELAAKARESIARLVVRFDDPTVAYPMLRRSTYDIGRDDYAHLARVKAWSAIGAEVGDE